MAGTEHDLDVRNWPLKAQVRLLLTIFWPELKRELKAERELASEARQEEKKKEREDEPS